MTRCTFKQGQYNCGSYAFNLYKEDIDQGEYCDRHYWQDQAQKAVLAEREACAKVCQDAISSIWECHSEDVKQTGTNVCNNLVASIRARGQS